MLTEMTLEKGRDKPRSRKGAKKTPTPSQLKWLARGLTQAGGKLSLFDEDGQRVSGLRFGDPVVLAVLTALLMFRLLPRGFSNRDLRETVARLVVRSPDDITPGQMTYQLRRLRLRGFIQRIARTHRYRLTDTGLSTALFYTSSMSHVIRPLHAALNVTGGSLQQRILRKVHPLVQSACESKQAA